MLRRRGRDDRAGVAEGVELQTERRPQHGFGGKRRQARTSWPTAASRRPSARARVRRRRPNRPRSAARSSARNRPGDRCEREIRSRCSRPECSIAGRGATGRRESRGRHRSARTRPRPPVVGRGTKPDADAGHACERPNEAMNLERRLDRQAQRDARGEIIDLEPPIDGLGLGAQHVGVACVRPSTVRMPSASNANEPPFSSSRMRAKTDGLSKRGMQSQSMLVSGLTSASSRPLPITPWLSSIRRPRPFRWPCAVCRRPSRRRSRSSRERVAPACGGIC